MEQIWTFERLAITVARVDFHDPDPIAHADGRERGVRLEVRERTARRDGSIYASSQVTLEPGLCRIDLLESAPYAADRMHWHPAMPDGEPDDRVFDVTMVDDPLQWLTDHLTDLRALLDQCGVAIDAEIEADLDDVRRATPDIVRATAEGLAWARVDPWPDVVRDERGLATTSAW